MTRNKVLALVGISAISAVLAGCGASSSPTSSDTFTTINEYHGITVGAPYNPFNPNGNTWLGYDQMQLAYFTNSLVNPNSFIPGLAQKWQLNPAGTVATVWLQPNAKWSNGQPVTANDVKASMAIAFAVGNAQAFDLGSVTVINPHEIQFSQLPGQHYNLFLNQLLQQTVVPAAEFAPVLPKNIWSIIQTAQYTGNNPAELKAATNATNQLTAIGKKITAYAPPRSADLSAGPFMLKSLNPGEAILVKNPDFFAANNVHVAEVVMRNYTGNQQIWNYLEAGQLDFAPYTSMPTNVLNQVLKTSSNVEVKTPSMVAAALAFNENIYPYGIPAVRRALAYIINRPEVQKIAEPVSGIPAKWSDGLVDSATQDWLSPAQQAELNPYNYNPAKATQLLLGAGFKKVNGQWIMPDGKPWTMTIYTVNGFSDWIAAAKVMATQLTNFGINANPDIVSSYAEDLNNLQNGQYAVAMYLNALGPTPQNAFNRIYGPADGYNLVGTQLVRYSASQKGKGNWIDMPAQISEPNGTLINPGVLTNELGQISSPAQQKPIVAQLALATDYNVPMITLWDYVNVQFVNTSRFTDLPIHNAALMDNPAGVWMMEGYVKPKA